MFRLLSKKIVVLDKALLESWLRLTPIERDRPLRANRVKHLMNELRDGKFTGATWAAVELDGKKYRVNGQHTSHMFSTLDKLPEILITLENYKADTQEDVANLYSTFDSQVSARNQFEIYGQYMIVDPNIERYGPTFFNKVTSGISYAVFGDRMPRAADRAKEALKYPDFFHHVRYVVGRAGATPGASDMIMRQPVLAAMWKTWEAAPLYSEAFWEIVATGADPNPKDPTRVLNAYLLRTSVSFGTAANKKAAESRHRMCSKCVTAFNAWIKGDSTALKYSGNLPKAKKK